VFSVQERYLFGYYSIDIWDTNRFANFELQDIYFKLRTNFVTSSKCYNYKTIYDLQIKKRIYVETVMLLESFVLYIDRLEEYGLLFTEPNLLFQSELNVG